MAKGRERNCACFWCRDALFERVRSWIKVIGMGVLSSRYGVCVLVV